MKQVEVTKKTPLLDRKGGLLSPGYARRMHYVYNREKRPSFSFQTQGMGFLPIH
jgi:hypothetical protein